MNEKLRKVVSDPKFAPLLTGLVSFGVGIGIGYILGRNQNRQIHVVPARKPFDHEAMEAFLEREENKRGIIREKKVEEVIVETPVVDHSAEEEAGADFVARHLEEEIQSHQGSDPEETETVEEVRRSIFAENSSDWDYDEELRTRSPAVPYILHRDEFYGEEKADDGYTQTTMTYYEGDDIMCKEDDTPLYNYASVVGPLRFGHGSDDPKVFHVRNDRRKEEYEIIHDPGLFSVEVLNLEIEDNQRVKSLKEAETRKFRASD